MAQFPRGQTFACGTEAARLPCPEAIFRALVGTNISLGIGIYVCSWISKRICKSLFSPEDIIWNNQIDYSSLQCSNLHFHACCRKSDRADLISSSSTGCLPARLLVVHAQSKVLLHVAICDASGKSIMCRLVRRRLRIDS